MPIESGDRWFSPKCIEVQQPETSIVEVERCMGQGPGAGYQSQANCECHDSEPVRETAGAKLRRRKGNSPDPQLRSLNRCLVFKAVRAPKQPGCWLRRSHHSQSP